MPAHDLVLRGGKIVTTEATFDADICISDGKIVTIQKSSDHPAASRIIDARGMLVFPGLIDSHVHFRDPGMTHKEDFETGTKGAAAGGVTTVFDMPTTLPVVTNRVLFNEKIDIVSGKAVVDFALYGAASTSNLTEIPKLAKAGAIALKTYTVSPPKDRLREYEGSFVTNSGQLHEVMQEVKKTGLLHCIHAEDDPTIQYLTQRLQAEGRNDPMAHHDSRPNFTEAEAVFEAILMSEMTGARVHIVHVSTSEATSLIQDAKQRGISSVTAETCPHYLYFSKGILEKRGPYAKYNPPPRDPKDSKALLRGITDGTIDTIVTDHAPHSKAEKEVGWENIYKAPPGTPGVETRLPLLLNMVKKETINLNMIPKVASEAVAKIFGLYPRKGSISVGSDADLAIVDFKEEWQIKAADLQTKAWECVLFDGLTVQGRVKYTILRGNVVYEDEAGFGKPGSGKFVGGRKSAGVMPKYTDH
jgi:allantoinase